MNTLLKKIPWESLTKDEKKDFQPYVVNLFLSQHINLVGIVNTIQRGKSLPKEIIYKMYLDILPNKKIYTSFIKKKSEDKYPLEFLKIIAKLRKNDLHDAYLFSEYSTKEELIHILKGYHIEDKIINKWLNKKN